MIGAAAASFPTTMAAGVLRKARFTGFHRVEGGDTAQFETLRAELGETGAAQLVTRIGERLLAEGIAGRGVSHNYSLGEAVVRVISAMTAAERTEVANGGIPARVASLVENEKATALAGAKAAGRETAQGESPQAGSGNPGAARSGLLGLREPMGGEASARSSSRFTGLADASDPAVAQARMWAEKLPGMGWAVNNPDLLRLGPVAIQTLAAVGYGEKTYNRLTKEGKFEPAQAVALAGFAKKRGMNPEQAKDLADAAIDVSVAIGKQDAEAQRAYLKALTEFSNAKPEEAAAKGEALKSILNKAVERDPAIKEKTDTLQRQLGIATEENAAAQKNDKAAVTQARTDVTQARTDVTQARTDVTQADRAIVEQGKATALKSSTEDFLNGGSPTAPASDPSGKPDKPAPGAAGPKTDAPAQPPTPTRVAAAQTPRPGG